MHSVHRRFLRPPCVSCLDCVVQCCGKTQQPCLPPSSAELTARPPADTMQVSYRRLERGTFVRFQPLSRSFHTEVECDDVREVLEGALSAYGVLTEGDVLVVEHKGQMYDLKVRRNDCSWLATACLPVCTYTCTCGLLPACCSLLRVVEQQGQMDDVLRGLVAGQTAPACLHARMHARLHARVPCCRHTVC